MTQSDTTCPHCGAEVPEGFTCRDLYNKLSLYTLAHHDPSFIHQHIVDAYAASHGKENTKPITTAFALIGLYLFVERGYSGKQVQNAHVYLGNKSKTWPTFLIPKTKTTITVSDVLNTPPCEERDALIKNWARSVWGVWKNEHEKVAFLVTTFERDNKHV